MVIEAGVAAGYVVAWAMRKARRVAGRADAMIDASLDTGMEKLAGAVEGKLGAHPALDDLAEEAAADEQRVSELTRQQIELALTAAARRDEEFGRTVTDLVAQIRASESAGDAPVVAGAGPTLFTGDADVRADGYGIAFGQVAGGVHLNRESAGDDRPDPSGPGRSRR
ncbi:hypothetical protein ACWC6I_41155 [Streptomyces sp. NPDC001414]